MSDFPKVKGYRIEKELNDDSLANTYLAVQESIGRDVVLKIFKKETLRDKDFSERFISEQNQIINFMHENIVLVFETGKVDGRFFVAREVAEESLSNLLRESKGKGIGIADALDYLKMLADALEYAHSFGIVHRDINPFNIRFRDKKPVLMNFGMTRQYGKSKKLKKIGLRFGTSAYMSPEQALGKELDKRSDIYSLGVLFYEMLTGRVPYEGATQIEIENKHLTEPVPELDGNLAQFQPVLNMMMEKDPEQRCSSAGEIAEAVSLMDVNLFPELTVDMGDNKDTGESEVKVSSESPERRSLLNTDYEEKKSPADVIKSPAVIAGAALFLVAVLIIVFVSGGTEQVDENKDSGSIKSEKKFKGKTVRGIKKGSKRKKVAEKSSAEKKAGKNKQDIPPKKAVKIKYRVLTMENVIALLRKNNFFDNFFNKKGGIVHDYKVLTREREKVVTDSKTGLMWQHAGSTLDMSFRKAEAYLKKINKEGYFGYHDWRIPRFREAAGLMENRENSAKLMISDLFSDEQRYIWAGNKSDKKRHGWALDFSNGDWNQFSRNNNAYVRLVRDFTPEDK